MPAHVVEEDRHALLRERDTVSDDELVPYALRHVSMREIARGPRTRPTRLLRRVWLRQTVGEGMVQHMLDQGAYDDEKEGGRRGEQAHEEEKGDIGGIVRSGIAVRYPSCLIHSILKVHSSPFVSVSRTFATRTFICHRNCIFNHISKLWRGRQ